MHRPGAPRRTSFRFRALLAGLLVILGFLALVGLSASAPLRPIPGAGASLQGRGGGSRPAAGGGPIEPGPPPHQKDRPRPPSDQGQAGFRYYLPLPSGTVAVSRPEIGLRLVLTPDFRPDQVLAALELDGQPLETTVRADGWVGQRPPAPLAPGLHQASIYIAYRGYYAEESWTFRVLRGAPPDPPAPDRAALDQVARLDRIRLDLGLQPVAGDAALTAAARSHLLYLELNRPGDRLDARAHEEEPGTPGFTGAGPLDRARAYGAVWPAAREVIEAGASSPAASLAAWMDSIYHRIALLDPGARAAGYSRAPLPPGSDRWASVMVLGAVPVPGLGGPVAYPYDGQPAVPTAFYPGEVPDPLKLVPHASYPTGYPITVGFYGSAVRGVEVRSASLAEADGRPVPFWLLTPGDGSPQRRELEETVVLLPRKPLEAGRSYVYSVSGVAETGGGPHPFTVQARFSTAGLPPMEPGGPAVLLDGRPFPGLGAAAGAPAGSSPPLWTAGGHLMVPFRLFFQGLGWRVAWSPARPGLARAEKDGSWVEARRSSLRLASSRGDFWMEVPSRVEGGTLYVPLRWAAEAAGLDVEWDPAGGGVRLFR
ncbi:MAG: stalk domain-containing protein [Bacillota bacterium]|nr:stalk domain-containing protein [Bacillota bacterium]